MNHQLLEALGEMVQKAKSVPKGIEINPAWLDQQIKLGNILKNDGNDTTDLSVLSGVPVYLNPEIETYKFIYH